MGTTGIPPISTPVLWKAVFPLQVLRCPTSSAPRSGYLYVAVLAGPVTNLQTRQDNSELGKSKILPTYFYMACFDGKLNEMES